MRVCACVCVARWQRNRAINLARFNMCDAAEPKSPPESIYANPRRRWLPLAHYVYVRFSALRIRSAVWHWLRLTPTAGRCGGGAERGGGSVLNAACSLSYAKATCRGAVAACVRQLRLHFKLPASRKLHTAASRWQSPMCGNVWHVADKRCLFDV